jgi:cytochrome d ubiquinol oxidase subunit II
MFSFAAYLDLPLIFGGILGLALIIYVLLDGFDLGVGILLPFAPTEKCRDTMLNSIAPFWDGNETWLVLGGGGLFAVFPKAYAIIMPALYVPIIIMLIALIFRGVAFEFRFKANKKERPFWNMAFHFGSLIATFAQGLVLGGYVQGITVKNGVFAGGNFDWLTAFSFLCGIALLCGYALLGATWSVMKTEGQTKIWAQKAARYLILLVVLFMGLVSLWVPFLNAVITARWFGWPNTLLLSPLPIGVVALALFLTKHLNSDHDYYPFFAALGIFVLGYCGLAISLWPNIVPHHVSLWEAAGPPEALSLMLIGVVLVLPLILFYTGYVYWVFRGKSTHEVGYGHEHDAHTVL